MLFYLVLVVVFLLPAIAGLVIFGNTPGFTDTIVFRLRRRLLASFSQIKRGYDTLNHRLGGKLLYYINWLIPIGYLLLVTYCFEQFFSKTYPILQHIGLSPLSHVYIYTSIILVYVATTLATITSPGQVKSNNETRFPNNQLIFFNNKICHTCNIIKPARSKHCSVCNKCFLLFDHHCIWINNCVGLRNYKWFMLYLISNINFLIYGGYLCYSALNFKAIEWDLGLWATIQHHDSTKVTGMFVILCFAFSIITLVFTLLHLRYIYLGVTTNEADKWSDVEYLINSGLLYKLESPIDDEIYAEKVYLQNGTGFMSLNSEKLFELEGSDFVKIESIETDIDNIYDKGFWNNLKERLLG